jgi:hypothetical protein
MIFGAINTGGGTDTADTSKAGGDVIAIPASAFHAPSTDGAVFTEVEGIPAFAFDYVSNTAVIIRIYNDGRITTATFDIALRLKSASDEATDNTSKWLVKARFINDDSTESWSTAEDTSVDIAVADDEKITTITGIAASGTVSESGALEIHIERDPENADGVDDYADDVYLLAATLEINK